jgi:hypothetical protein
MKLLRQERALSTWPKVALEIMRPARLRLCCQKTMLNKLQRLLFGSHMRWLDITPPWRSQRLLAKPYCSCANQYIAVSPSFCSILVAFSSAARTKPVPFLLAPHHLIVFRSTTKIRNVHMQTSYPQPHAM